MHNYSLRPDSGGAGTWRGGAGVICEIEPVGHTITAVVWGEGRKYPASGARGAGSGNVRAKVGRADQAKLDNYLQSVRAVEKQIESNTRRRAEENRLPPAVLQEIEALDRSVQKWESPGSGKHPTGAAARLLQVIEKKGVEAIIVG